MVAAIQMTDTIIMRNSRGEYLFISKHQYDDSYCHVVLTDRNGSIIRSYDLPISQKTCVSSMRRAGWKEIDL